MTSDILLNLYQTLTYPSINITTIITWRQRRPST